MNSVSDLVHDVYDIFLKITGYKKLEYSLNFKKINKFEEIISFSNSLYIFDIDDTILYYKDYDKEWLNSKIESYIKQGSLPNTAKTRAIIEWEDNISKSDPIAIDNDCLLYLFKNINYTNGEIYFITSRGDNIKDITKNHIKKIIPFNNIEDRIIFTNGKNKGLVLQNLLNTTLKDKNFENISFIDDIIQNLENVYKLYPNSKFYHFENKNKNNS